MTEPSALSYLPRVIAWIVLLMWACTLFAQPTSYAPTFSSTPNWTTPNWSLTGEIDRGPLFSLSIINAQVKALNMRRVDSNGFLASGLAGGSVLDFNGLDGTAVGVYGHAVGSGTRGNATRQEVVGIYGRADLIGPRWATALHGEVIVGPQGGGTGIGTNIELHGANPTTTLIGINVQPSAEQRDVIGLQFQRPESYRYSIDLSNTFVKIGQVDSVPFCIKFNPSNQYMEFWRGCQSMNATRHGWINMNFGTPDVQLNR